MPILAFPFGSVIDVPSGRILARDDAGTGPAEALTNLQLFAILGTGTPSASTYLRGDGAWATVSAGVGGSTGSVDNAVLRADGTGGATLQASAFVIADNYTASPNATVNHASLQATGATTNVSVSIVPKGSGAFSLHVPDGTATGGNVRGANAVDLQTARTAANQVASGASSIAIGTNNRAEGTRCFSIGYGNTCTAVSGFGNTAIGEENSVTTNYWGVGIGARNTVSGSGYNIAIGHLNISSASADTISVAIGQSVVASANQSFGTGHQSRANRHGQRSHAGGMFAVNGDCQLGEIVLRGSTTTNAAVRLRPDGSSQRLTIASGQVCQFLLIVTGVRNGGADVATYMRQVTIKNIGGTTSLVGTVNTIGTDNAAGTSLSVTADDTNDDLAVEPTGVSGQTWRWQCVVYGGELRHGT